MGPIMLDVAGFELSSEEREVLAHPLVGGLILFTRNYHDPQQLAELVRQIRQSAKDDILIAVDHEGGRVQRFRKSFSKIPAMGNLWTEDAVPSEQSLTLASEFAWLMASELLSLDIDISFAPVLDICGISEVIGDRSFHPMPQHIVPLASAFIQGMHEAGMKATGKHFPGHGNVKEDSHIAMPIDTRSKEDIMSIDMQVFQAIQQRGLLDAVMPAHVIYPAVDTLPAGFSSIWIQHILRQQMGFDGVVFSDDLSMKGAEHLGSYAERAHAALVAGADMTLVCNNPKGAIEVLDQLDNNTPSSKRARTMLKSPVQLTFEALKKTPRYRSVSAKLDAFHAD